MALTTIYIIDSTDGSTSFAIQPRTFDGTNGVQQNTDLTLYGNSTPTWGEKFNENFYRSLENFAIDKQGFNPGTDVFDPADATIQIPKNQFDLSVTGLGVNNPIEGQLWYNKTDNKLYVYSSTGWRSTGMASTSPPTSPISGDLWFDGTTLELKFYNGTTWNSVLTGAANFVLKTGDTMTGDLNLSSNLPTLFFTEEDETVGSQIWTIKGQTGDLIVQALDNLSTGSGGGNIFKFTRTTNQVDSFEALQSGITWLNINNTSKSLTLTSAGSLILEHDPVLALEAATKQYVDGIVSGGGGTFVAITGDTMTGDLTFDASISEKIITIDAGAGNGKFEIGYDGLSPTKKVRFNTNLGVQNDFMVFDPVALITTFDQQSVFNGITTFNNNVNVDTANISMINGSDVILDHDPVVPLEAATKQYVDTSVSGVTGAGQLLSIDKLSYKSYYDINSDSFVTVPGFNVNVVVSTAPVTYISTAIVSLYFQNAGSSAFFELMVVGGEYTSPNTLYQCISNGSSGINHVQQVMLRESGTLLQNTTYNFYIRVRNGTTAPTQDSRINANESFPTSAEPDTESSIEVLTFS